MGYPEQNPIELIWNKMKCEAAKSSFALKLLALEEVARTLIRPGFVQKYSKILLTRIERGRKPRENIA